MKHWLGWVGCSLLDALSSIDAQVVGGEVVESVSQRPLAQIPVFLLRDVAGKRSVVRDVTTDASGLFQAAIPGPGTYQLAFGDSLRPISLGPLDSLTADTTLLRRFSVPLQSHVFTEQEVELPAQALPKQNAPRYPEHLRNRNIEGSVLMSMIVDTTGRVDMTSIEVKFATHPDFAVSVRDALKGARFIPAKWHGFVVRQVLTQPFSFGVVK